MSMSRSSSGSWLSGACLMAACVAAGAFGITSGCGSGSDSASDAAAGGSDQGGQGGGGTGGHAGTGGSSGAGGHAGAGGTGGHDAGAGGSSGSGGSAGHDAGAAGASGAGGGAGKGGTSGSGGVGGTGGAKDAGVDAPVVSCSGVPKLKLTKVADANSPLALAQPAGDARLYIVERGGTIRFLRNGTLSPFFTLPVAPMTDGERGLLSMAFHPQYAANGRFFIYYVRAGNDTQSTGDAGDLVIAEGKRAAGNGDSAEGTVKPLVIIGHKVNSNHNGGNLAFGPDGYLYAGVGDGGAGGDPFKAGQDPTAMLGKILRVDVDNPGARPAGNYASPADPRVFIIGLRNPWRWSFDRLTGEQYIGDVGQDAYEEVDVLPKGMTGLNLGWSVMEAKHCYGGDTCDMSAKWLPVIEYAHGGAGNCVIGGYVYRGTKIPCLAGRYLYGDHGSNEIQSFVYKNGQATAPVTLTSDLSTTDTRINGLVSFGQDAAGELYLLDEFSHIYRIDAE